MEGERNPAELVDSGVVDHRPPGLILVSSCRRMDAVGRESPVNTPARPGRVTPATSVVLILGPRYCCDEPTTVHRTAFRRDVWSAKFTTACSTCSPSVNKPRGT